MATFDTEVPLLVVGAGACGLTAALAARENGVAPLVLERDPVPRGSTALSSGMIPACATAIQKARGVEDNADRMARDIIAKAKGQVDEGLVRAICHDSGPVIDWLTGQHGLNLTLVEGFLYPGHSRLRMHAPPSRAGADLAGGLTAAAARAGIDMVTGAKVTDLFALPDGTVCGVAIARPDGAVETLGCKAVILACNGFGGNPAMVRDLIPDMSGAIYFGHDGNQGDAILWGRALGAGLGHLGAFQGHGSVAHPHGILISWALMMEGGIQINREGRRFSNEHDGYSEQARRVLAQPGGIVWDIFDDRLHALANGLDDYRKAISAGAVKEAPDISRLAAATGVPETALRSTLAEVGRLVQGQGRDRFGRDFTSKPPLSPPYRAIRVTGALFHTQGGLLIDRAARVLRENAEPLPNIFAGGGAACGISGPADWGYLSGNGLLTAVVLGWRAGRSAAKMLRT